MRAALALLLILAVGRTAAAEPERVGLVVSGGISLGSYQAGVLYARIKDLRARRAEAGLELVTGASAGSINAWLTVVGWCDDRPERMAFFANPFFDIWTNVGLDALLPLTDDGATYARLVGETLGSARVVRIGRDLAAAPEPPDPWAAGEHPQGLLTRNAFGVVGRYLAERLADTGYRDGCRVRTAVTLTGAEAVELPLAAGDATVRTLRFVVPLTAEVTGGRLAVRNDGVDVAAGDASCWDPAAPDGRHPWEACHPSIGRTLGLPVGAGGVPGRAVVGLVQAASAFPVAFSPVPLATCASRGAAEAPGPGCTDGLAAHAGRFIDGGFFDNVPLGPAVEIAHDEDLRWRGQGRVPGLTLHYVDPEQRRGAARLPENRRRPDGLGAFTRLVQGVYREARSMELQGLERHCRAELFQENPSAFEHFGRRLRCGPETAPPGGRRFVPSSRFHGITGRLAGSFGAFLHRDFRVHDYLVGVYDGSLIASREHLACPADATPAGCRAESFRAQVERQLADFDRPQPEDGALPRRPSLGGHPATPEDVRRFLYRLFVHEHRQLDPAAAEALCARMSAADAEVACGEGHHALARQSLVWALHCVFTDLDAQLRAAVLTSDLQARRQQAGLETDLGHVLEALEPYLALAPPGRPGELAGDRRAWQADLQDRLARRALAVERADQAALASLGSEVVDLNARVLGLDVIDALQIGRTAAASLVEREDVFLDLDAGTTHRLLGNRWWTPLVDLLVPHHLAADPLYGGLMAGSTPHLRLRGFRTPGRPTTVLERMSLAVDAGVAVQDAQPVFEGERFSARLGAGLGYDPPGRLVDDLDLLYLQTRPLPAWDEAAHGVELSVRLATRLRLAVGSYTLDAPALYFTVGLADWLSLLVGLWEG
ncbi:MAG: patatin-like phospholipase family protein [bacterium]